MNRNKNVPRCMSTQHPDNVKAPFFSDSSIIGGETEIKEAYYAFSHLCCSEQMWDCEGKEVDNFVVKKLLTMYGHFFSQKILGRDLFLTLRVPNPSIERNEAKILLETLESIPRSFDAAKAFYGDNNDIPPIFEVILPMTTSYQCLNRIYGYYKDFVVGKENTTFQDGVKISEWIGEFKPKEINVIPLFEDMEHLLNLHAILRRYLEGKRLETQRVFLARSDPALNYGMLSAMLINKIALSRLQKLEEELSVDILPILGVGSAPFRGNNKPSTVKKIIDDYPSVQTITIQSAFKYDYEESEVRRAINHLNNSKRGKALDVDEQRCLRIIQKVRDDYAKCISVIANQINEIARYVPSRRKRKLHIGLFGYSRTLDDNKNIHLPRAIKFCASLYSIGIPPELFGLSALNSNDLDFVIDVCKKFENDMQDAIQYINKDNLKYIPQAIRIKLQKVIDLFADKLDVNENEEHRKITSEIMRNFSSKKFMSIRENIIKAAWIRRFLG